MSADAMLAALLGSKHKVSMDLRSNLKQVKKELKEEVGASFHKAETDLKVQAAHLRPITSRLKSIETKGFCFLLLLAKQTGDWRKNIEDKAGMDGRKKMFEAEALPHYRTSNFCE